MKLGTIKSVKIRGYTLSHERHINFAGLPVETFDLFDSKKKIHKPITPPIKVKNYTRNTPINGCTNYSRAELLKVLRGELTQFWGEMK